jgi:hypothetical protein
VERLLVILKKCFPILKVSTFHKIWNQLNISAGTAIFHYIIKEHHGDEDWLDNQEDNIDPNDFMDLTNDDDDVVQHPYVVYLPGNNLEFII